MSKGNKLVMVSKNLNVGFKAIYMHVQDIAGSIKYDFDLGSHLFFR